MILEQYYLNCLAHASYLIGDLATRTAVVVDPQRDVDRYVDDAARHGLRIRHVFLTHFHADFVAGHLELRDRTGARIYLGARAQAEYPFVPMADGASLDCGRVRLTVLETPGHTIESISLLVFDLDRDRRQPQAILTGDTLFIGDVGRPDLRASLGWSAAELGRLLYRSLHAKILPLPDATLIYPAHGAGSLCGKNLSTETVSTLGVQRRANYALQPMSEAEFLRLVTVDQPDAPPYFAYDAVLNTQERSTLQAVLRGLNPLGLDEMLALKDAGAQVLDVREPAEYAQAHLVGSLNIGLGGTYATWAGTILDRSKPIVIVAEPGRQEEAAMRLGRIGFDTVAGYLEGGLLALEARPDLLDATARVTPAEAAQALGSPAPPVILDVRSPKEWQQTRIDGSLNIPLNRLIDRIQELPRQSGVLVHCAGGYRSSIAAGLLQRHGVRDLIELAGGVAAWERAGLPLRHSPQASGAEVT
ncbi:MAG TPA: MBL fold metallo-hydrolase [Thermoanaerobaculia bacterium]|nr:MBL fold metallo-hydrolase [Thermoanaerobaculia bacterium]